MDFKQFHAAVGKTANGRYFSASVEVSTTSHGTEVEWRGYIHNMGSRHGGSPDEVLAQLTGELTQTTVDDVGEVPTADTVPPPAEPTQPHATEWEAACEAATLDEVGSPDGLRAWAMHARQQVAELIDMNAQLTREVEVLKRGKAPRDEIAPRPVVRWFAEQMELKLREKDGHKPSWHETPPKELMSDLGGEVLELCDEFDVETPDAQAVIREAADVAATAMMVADHFREGGPSRDRGHS